MWQLRRSNTHVKRKARCWQLPLGGESNQLRGWPKMCTSGSEIRTTKRPRLPRQKPFTWGKQLGVPEKVLDRFKDKKTAVRHGDEEKQFFEWQTQKPDVVHIRRIEWPVLPVGSKNIPSHKDESNQKHRIRFIFDLGLRIQAAGTPAAADCAGIQPLGRP
jgi:hypothetical protein